MTFEYETNTMLNALEYKSCFTLKCHITNKMNFMLTLERKQKYKHAMTIRWEEQEFVLNELTDTQHVQL